MPFHGVHIHASSTIRIVAALLPIVACTGPAADGVPASADPFLVGPDGGVHDFGEATVTVPQGALDETVEIRLIETDDDPPEPFDGLSRVWRAEPEGLVFAEPITITLPIDPDQHVAVGQSERFPGAWWADPDDAGAGYERFATTVVDTRTRVETQHLVLSQGFLADVPEVTFVEEQPFQPMDILFVVDGTSSMDFELEALTAASGALFEVLSGSSGDFHVAVTSMNFLDATQAGRLVAVDGQIVIDPTTPQPEAVFDAMVTSDVTGFDEKGRTAAYAMVELTADEPWNAGFIREDATLSLVFVSDAHDQSGAQPISEDDFGTWMETKKARPEDVVAHAIVHPMDEPCPQGEIMGVSYIRYAEWTNGAVFSSCDEDWAPAMSVIASRPFFEARVVLPEPVAQIRRIEVVEPTGTHIVGAGEWSLDPATNTVWLAPLTASPQAEAIHISYVPDLPPIDSPGDP